MVHSQTDVLNAVLKPDYNDPILDSIVIPDYVYEYEPKGDYIWTTLRNGLKVRYIFTNFEFTDSEKEHIRAFKIFATQKLDGPQLESELAIESFNRRFSGTVFGTDGYVLRYLIGNNYSYPDVLNDMYNHLKWRKATLPIKRSEVETDISRGFVYVHGRDKCMRPIIVMRASQMDSNRHDMILKCVYFVLEMCLAKLMIPGKVEQWRVILDLDGTNIFTIQVSLLKQIARALSVNYRSRLSQMYIINAPYVISCIWNLVKGVIPQVTQEKIIISSSKNTKKLLEIIEGSQLEKKYGGKAANATMYDIPIMPEL